MEDRFNLERFVNAQARDYETALGEIRQGAKRSHWMWYIFPQYGGLGRSPTARHYAIRSIGEAKAYLAHPLLGVRLRICIEALAHLEDRTAEQVFGELDAMKLRSSLTLFIEAGGGPDFEHLLGRWFAGLPDEATIELIARDDGL